MSIRKVLTFVLIAAAQFGLFEAGLRTWGSSEAAPSFQGLFEPDPAIGFRLKPHARMRFTTSEFTADIAINGAGLRDDEELGPKSPQERRIVLLGDSLVLSVQVPFQQTFGELLERRLNSRSSAVSLPCDQRRRAGVRPHRGAALLSHDRGDRAAGSGSADRLRRQRRRGGGALAKQARTPSTWPNHRRLAADASATARPAQHGPADSPPPHRGGHRPRCRRLWRLRSLHFRATQRSRRHASLRDSLSRGDR